MNTKQSILYIDDTGSVGAGSYVAVPATIASDTQIERETVEERCRGDAFVTESPGDLKAAITLEVKFALSDPLLQRFVTALVNGDQIGVLDNTGDRTVAGHQGLEMNALVKQVGMPKPAGDYVKYTISMAPHADNANANLPQIVTAA